MLVVVHFLLDCRELRDIRCYQDDPLVRRILGLTRLSVASTLSRALAWLAPIKPVRSSCVGMPVTGTGTLGASETQADHC